MLEYATHSHLGGDNTDFSSDKWSKSFFLSRRANGNYRGLQKSFQQKNAANKLNQTGVHLANRGAKPSAGVIRRVPV